MASNEKRNDVAFQRNQAMSSDYSQRATLAINRLVPGPNRDKSVARKLGCSVRFAQYLQHGQHWTIDWLNRASAAIEGFDAYLASPDFHNRLDEIEQELAEIRSNLRGQRGGE